jgi:hypothetical protein
MEWILILIKDFSLTGLTGFFLNGMISYFIFVAFLKKPTNLNRLRRTVKSFY